MGYIDFSTLVRPARPNTYLIAPEGLCKTAEPDAVSPVWPMLASDLYARILSAIEGERLWTVTNQSSDAFHVVFVARTPLLGFKDDIDIQVQPSAGDGSESQLAIYSRSRVGYSDLGANAKRVGKLMELLPEPKKPG